MPNRILREGVLDSDRVNGLSAEAEVMFYRLILVADDYGCYDGRPTMIQSRCWPIPRAKMKITLERVVVWLSELEGAGLIVFYEDGGKPYVEVVNSKQRTRAQSSKFPIRGEHTTVLSLSHDGHWSVKESFRGNGSTPPPKYASASASASVRTCRPDDAEVQTDDGHVSDVPDADGVVSAPDQRVNADFSPVVVPPPPIRRPEKSGSTRRIGFDEAVGNFSGIEDADMARWQSAYPDVAVPQEIEKAAAWCKANAGRRPKSRYEAFLVGWFNREQGYITRRKAAQDQRGQQGGGYGGGYGGRR